MPNTQGETKCAQKGIGNMPRRNQNTKLEELDVYKEEEIIEYIQRKSQINSNKNQIHSRKGLNTHKEKLKILERKVEHIKIAKHNERTITQKDSNTMREPINDKRNEHK